MSDGKGIIYKSGQAPAWLELGSGREDADKILSNLLTENWDTLPLFRWVGEPGGTANGFIGWYLLYSTDALIDSEPNETALALYQAAHTTRKRPWVLCGRVVLVCMKQPWTSPTVDRTLPYFDITAGADRGFERYISGSALYWPKSD